MSFSTLFDVNHLLGAYGYIGIFLIVFIESGVFFFLPGDSLLFAAGLLAATGKMYLALILVLAVIAAFLGNIVGYWIGSHAEKLKRFRLFKALLKDEHMGKARKFFDDRGRSALLMARFLPGVRTFTPWIAGMVRMDREVFLAWSAAGAVVWVGIMTFAGFFLGKAFPGIEKYLTEALILIVLVSILPGAVGWYRHHAQRARK